jgi:hypothetical protein
MMDATAIANAINRLAVLDSTTAPSHFLAARFSRAVD